MDSAGSKLQQRGTISLAETHGSSVVYILSNEDEEDLEYASLPCKQADAVRSVDEIEKIKSAKAYMARTTGLEKIQPFNCSYKQGQQMLDYNKGSLEERGFVQFQ